MVAAEEQTFDSPKDEDAKEQSVSLEVATKAVDDGAKHVATFYAAFLVSSAYVAMSAASTTDKMMLLESPLTLPIVNVGVPLLGFFLLIPLVYVLLHLNLLLHVRMNREQVEVFEEVLRSEPGLTGEIRIRERDIRRTLLFPFLFLRVFGSPEQRGHVTGMFRLAYFTTVIWMPPLVLLYVQYRFLPFHDLFATYVHRFCLLSDLCLLVFLGVLWEKRSAFRVYPTGWRLTARKVSKYILRPVTFFAFVIASFAFLTVPTETLDRIPLPRRALHRNLTLHNEIIGNDLPSNKDFADILSNPTKFGQWLDIQPQLDLTHRRFDRADLSGCRFVRIRIDNTDFSNSNLAGTSWYGLEGQHANFSGTDLSSAWLPASTLEMSDFGLGSAGQLTKLVQCNLSGDSLRGCDFSNALMTQCDLRGAKLSPAKSNNKSIPSNLSNALMTEAKMAGTDLRDSRMDGTAMFNVQAQAAWFPLLQIQTKLDGNLDASARQQPSAGGNMISISDETQLTKLIDHAEALAKGNHHLDRWIALGIARRVDAHSEDTATIQKRFISDLQSGAILLPEEYAMNLEDREMRERLLQW